MFSGIVTGTGQLLRREELAGDRRLTIAIGDAVLSKLSPGCSIAVNGVCLTMVRGGGGQFSADVSLETLSATTLGRLRDGDPVNLEGALRLHDTVDGHLVTGHVDGVGPGVERGAGGTVGQAPDRGGCRVDAVRRPQGFRGRGRCQPDRERGG